MKEPSLSLDHNKEEGQAQSVETTLPDIESSDISMKIIAHSHLISLNPMETTQSRSDSIYTTPFCSLQKPHKKCENIYTRIKRIFN